MSDNKMQDEVHEQTSTGQTLIVEIINDGHDTSPRTPETNNKMEDDVPERLSTDQNPVVDLVDECCQRHDTSPRTFETKDEPVEPIHATNNMDDDKMEDELPERQLTGQKRSLDLVDESTMSTPDPKRRKTSRDTSDTKEELFGPILRPTKKTYYVVNTLEFDWCVERMLPDPLTSDCLLKLAGSFVADSTEQDNSVFGEWDDAHNVLENAVPHFVNNKDATKGLLYRLKCNYSTMQHMLKEIGVSTCPGYKDSFEEELRNYKRLFREK